VNLKYLSSLALQARLRTPAAHKLHKLPHLTKVDDRRTSPPCPPRHFPPLRLRYCSRRGLSVSLKWRVASVA
jgi:hypothetical protein